MKKMNKVIATVLVMLMLLSSVMFTLASCQDNTPDDGGTGSGGSNNNGGNNGGNQDGDDVINENYSVTIVTKGGMAMAELPVYIWEYEDAVLGEIVGYAATDATGKASFTLPKGEYAAQFSLPDGYDAESFYPLVSSDMKLEVSSSVIPETSLVGVSYDLGSVMHDFTITGNILVENEKGVLEYKEQTFTLSEVLKEKDAVLINFWFSTCGPCQNEFPLMQDAYEKYSDDLAIIALNPHPDDDEFTVQDYQGQMGLSFNVAKDTIDLYAAFGVENYPTSVMIDRYGVVTMLEVGSITSQRVFEVMFDYFTGEDYEQKLIYNYEDIVPKEKPDQTMPSEEEMSNAFDKGTIEDIEYLPYPDDAKDEEKEYSWPFIIGQIADGDKLIDCIYPSNSNKEGSFAQLILNLTLEAGEALAFDYYSSTELGADFLYVVVNGKDIYSISGESSEWNTCYAYVAEETDVYEVAFIYMKDSSDNVGEDTVYLKDLRIVTDAKINTPTYIYRFAATNPDEFSNYQDYITEVLGADGYYHVNSENGPILLADLMGYTRFSDENSVYYMAVELYGDGRITAEEYDTIIDYCNYASNSAIYGVCSVTPELKALLDKIVQYFGDSSNSDDWKKMCCYYDAYGTDGKQLEDPIKGLAFFSAYDVVISDKGATDFPNSFTYDRLIMPRGLMGKISPTVSGTYLIVSNTYDEKTNSYPESNAWIFVEGENGERVQWLTYDNVDKTNLTSEKPDTNNCYIIAYLEAGRDYYIDIAYYDVYGEGTINYRVEYLGGEGYYRFTLASPPFFTTLESASGDITGYIISGGIELELGEDGIWREKRYDGRQGSILYADFTNKTPLFSHSIIEMIEQGAFDFSRTEADQFVLDCIKVHGGVDECDAYLRQFWGEDYEENAEIYKLEEVYNTYLNGGNYHGKGKNYSDVIEKYLDNIIVEGYNEQLDETIAANDQRIGCVVVTEELAEILQLIMNKYTFMNGVEPNQTPIENSWAKFCYYTQYFCAATPK